MLGFVRLLMLRLQDCGLGALLEDPSIRLLVCDAVATVKMMKRAGFAPKEVMDVRLVYQELLNHSGDLGDLIALVSEADQPYVKVRRRKEGQASSQHFFSPAEASPLLDESAHFVGPARAGFARGDVLV
jgi:hypothetical protein